MNVITKSLRGAASRLTGTALSLVLLASLVPPGAVYATTGPVSSVNPMIGTSNYGNTTPAATAPFGMMEWGPATINRPIGNYSNAQPITGLSLTGLQGVGCNIFGDVPILPYSGTISGSPNDAQADLTNQTATPGSWSATVGTVDTALAVTARTGIAKLTFPGGSPAQVVIKAGDSLNGNTGATVNVAGTNEVTGSATSGNFCGQANSTYTLYFAIESDTAFASTNVYSASGAGAGVAISYGTPGASQTVHIKVGLSYVSVANAEANIASENSGWSESDVAAATSSAWNTLLSRVAVTGGTTDQRTIFYTALYHSLLAPQVFSDANGDYLGFDGAVHTLGSDETQYTNFSGWDIQYSEFPLLAMVVPDIAAQMAQSLVRDAQQGGALPRWPIAANYTADMEGDPADILLADAVAFGATKGFDTAAAATYAVQGATTFPSPSASMGQGWYYERYGGAAFNVDGYMASQASITLQYAMDAYAIAQLVSATGGDPSDMLNYSNNWINTFDSAVQLAEPRNSPPPYSDGSFQSTSATAAAGDTSQAGFTEGNAMQYTWLVPQHLDQLAIALGGQAQATARLSTFFTKLDATVQEPYYTATNEADIEAPWEFDWFGAPEKTQEITREILNQFYANADGGLPGNDDLGAMSSWAVFAMLGFYPEIPGTATLAVGSPLFTSAQITSETRTLAITAPGAGTTNPYIQATLKDNKPLGTPYFDLPKTGSVSVKLSMGASAATDAFTSTALVPAPSSSSSGTSTGSSSSNTTSAGSYDPTSIPVLSGIMDGSIKPDQPTSNTTTDRPGNDTPSSLPGGDNNGNITDQGKGDKHSSSAFLGLGWWWLLILAVILGAFWFIFGKANTDHKEA